MGSDPETVRLGLLGCADVALRRVLPAVSRSGAVRLVRSTSRNPDKAWKTAAQFGGEAVESYEQLLADTKSLHELAQDRGLVLRENSMFLGHRLHPRVASLLEEGTIGRVRSFYSAFTIPLVLRATSATVPNWAEGHYWIPPDTRCVRPCTSSAPT